MFCLPERFRKKNLRGAWKTASPWKDAILLDCGVSASRIPVSKGEPFVMSEVYREVKAWISAAVAVGRKNVWTHFVNCASVLVQFIGSI